MLAAPMRSSLPQIRFPNSDGPRVQFEVKRAVRARIEPRTARLTVRMGQDTPESISHPHQQAYRHAHYVNGGAVRRVASALRVTAVARAGRIAGIGTGNIKSSALRAGSTLASGRIEQGTGPSLLNP